MSLDASQRARTSRELRENFVRAARPPSWIAGDLDWTPERLSRTLAVDDASPADVWKLRDYLELVVRETGTEPVPFTVLTDRMRPSAQAWFGID